MPTVDPNPMSDAIQLPSEDLVRRLRKGASVLDALAQHRIPGTEGEALYKAAHEMREAADALSEIAPALPEVTTNDQQQPEK